MNPGLLILLLFGELPTTGKLVVLTELWRGQRTSAIP